VGRLFSVLPSLAAWQIGLEDGKHRVTQGKSILVGGHTTSKAERLGEGCFQVRVRIFIFFSLT